MDAESKHARFKRIASKRTNEILEKIRILGNCSNRFNYDYTDEEVERIFAEIEKQLHVARSRFERKEKQKFQL